MKIMTPIKWTGSKRHQVEDIISHFPKKSTDRYFEPFIGGGSVLLHLLRNRVFKSYFVSDINPDLIALWVAIQNEPVKLSSSYYSLHKDFNTVRNLPDKWDRGIHEHRKNFFYNVRKKFNETRATELFFFLLRTCMNGLVRYNLKNEFNSSCHYSRPGMDPAEVNKLIVETCVLIQDVKFTCCNYDAIKPKVNDFVYLDPPYFNTGPMYYGEIKSEEFFKWISDLKCDWALSLNGKHEDSDNTYDVPKIYKTHMYLKSGNSSFGRMKGKTRMVQESLYLS